jgi:hypothetical protein
MGHWKDHKDPVRRLRDSLQKKGLLLEPFLM